MLVVGANADKRGQYANPFIQAAMAESRSAVAAPDSSCGDYPDLEDFIVCKPDRDYLNLFAKHYRYSSVD